MRRVVFQRIVCAIDLSGNAALPLAQALDAANAHGSELRILLVTPRAVDDLDGLQRIIDGAGAASIRWIVVPDYSPAEIVRYADAARADLLVVGRSSTAGEPGVGAVVERVLADAPCPVLIVNAPRRSAWQREHILCAVASGSSTTALRYALSLAQEFQSRLTLFNAGPSGTSMLAASQTAAAIDELRSLIPETAMAWAAIDEVAAADDPVRAFVETAERSGPDLVILGAAATSATAGSLGWQMLAAATRFPADVLVVPRQRRLAWPAAMPMALSGSAS